jgi:hypothetical protein
MWSIARVRLSSLPFCSSEALEAVEVLLSVLALIAPP